MTDTSILEQVEELVRPTYQKIDLWCHGWLHILNVVRSAKEIAEIEGADPVLCMIAAYCHDLGRIKEEELKQVNHRVGGPSSHAGLSVIPTKKVLSNLNLSEKDKDMIVEAVKVHSVRKYHGSNKVALILQDADREDGFGPIGILRMAAFNCQMNIPEPKNKEEITQLIERVKSELKEDDEKRKIMIDTINFVFEWVDVIANTEAFKTHVKEKYEFNKKFLAEIMTYNSPLQFQYKI